VAAYPMNGLCIADSVRSGTAQKRKDTLDAINAMSSLVSILKIFHDHWQKGYFAGYSVLRKVGTEKWIQDEEARYVCPECGNKVFRGVVKCNQCKTQLDLD